MADQAGESMGNAFDQMQVAGTRITAAGLGIAAGLGSAVKTTADFDAQMSKVQALAGATAQDFQKLRNQAIQLGSDTSYSASQVSEGMTILVASG
ncbi:phage tail tape measure protein [Thermoflavimicrobium daqui]|uniref:Phage tail tape measure protein n=1 Tax=Thermoflavimicrobium daqui TaxID=2137476 RepID=A0A364K6P5_9BACL|nr:phage tail tape measure protein [Thermoflavimicrobium daqui]RAL25963.1 phage tail tape measure protein [Thermoflavimicrobium daqui]